MATSATPLSKLSVTPFLWLRRALLITFTGLAAWLAVKTLLSLVAPSSVWEPVLIAAPESVDANPSTEYDFTYNPFEAGDLSQVEPVAVQAGTDAPETTLNLTLVGLRSGENGTAFIRTPDGQDLNYYVADEIIPDVILRAVFPGYVLIDVNGQTQRLTMDDATLQTESRSGNGERQALQTLRPADARTLLSQARISIAQDGDGNRLGVRIEPRTSAFDLERYGFKQGDIITRFGGQSLTSGMPDINALRRLSANGRPVDVDLIRNGNPLTITIGTPS